MNSYQQKWIEVLGMAQLNGWKIQAAGDDINVEMPGITDLKLIRDNLPETLALISLDIKERKERLRFIFHNGHEQFDYILNPEMTDLTEANGER